jgi:hypothetical protein
LPLQARPEGLRYTDFFSPAPTAKLVRTDKMNSTEILPFEHSPQADQVSLE